MLEKFHQFNRQNNLKEIVAGLAELEPESTQKIGPTNNFKPKTINSTEKAEQVSVDNAEKERLFAALKRPRDILGLPKSLKKEGLAFLSEKIANRYLTISKIEMAIFNEISSLFEEGSLNPETLNIYIASIIEEYNLNKEDVRIINDLLYHFFRDLDKINELRDLPEQDLLSRLIRNPALLPLIQGGYRVKFTPFAIHFDFDREEDFRLFVSNVVDDVEQEYKSTYGLSYFKDDYPITASGYKPATESTFRHEIQHKKFTALTMDKILSDEEVERSTRNEILARFSEKLGNVLRIFDSVKYYGFAEKSGIDQSVYDEMLKKAVAVLQELQYMRFTNEEIITLLSREKITAWPKILKRIRGTRVGQDIIQQRKPKRVKRKKLHEQNNSTVSI